MADAAADIPAASCRIMTLPDEMLIAAGLRAVQIYPANNIQIEQIANQLGPAARDILTPQRIAAAIDKYWGPKERTITVQFLDSPTPTFRRMCLEAANSWDCSVTFAETSRDGMVRLSRNLAGYWSYLGTDISMVPAGQPTMNLQGFTEFTAASEWARVVPHEFGHTLGFVHEQLRPEVVSDLLVAETIRWYRINQGWDEATTRANVLTGLDARSLMGTPIDQDSIMAYWIVAELTKSGKGFRGGKGFTATDLAFADKIYPLPTAPPTPPPSPPDPDPGYSGPFDLTMGRISRQYEMLAGIPILFRFQPKGQRLFAMQTGGGLTLTMELYDGAWNLLKVDEDQSGLQGNAALTRALAPGTYYLKVKGHDASQSGPFRVKVGAVS